MTTPFPFVAGTVLTAAELNAITTLPINDKTASYTLLASDAGKRVVMNVASANTVTVDDDIFGVGDTVFIANKGAGATTVTAGAGVTINSASGLVLAQYQSGTLVALSASSFLLLVSDVTATSGVVQVKSTTKTDVFTMSSTSFADVTGLSVSITPTSASNKILVMVTMLTSNGGGTVYANLRRNSADIGIGDAAGSRTQVTGANFSADPTAADQMAISFLDSPATTSATTYSVQIAGSTGAVTMSVNAAATDTDTFGRPRGISTITVFEVKP